MNTTSRPPDWPKGIVSFEPFVVLGDCTRQGAGIVGELRDQQVTYVRVHHELLVAQDIELAIGIGFTIAWVDVHLAQVVQQTAQHGDADLRRLAA